MDNFEDNKVYRVVMEDEQGREVAYEVVGTFIVEQKPKHYMALHPENSQDEGEVILVRFKEGPDDSVEFENITDDAEYDIAAEVFEDLFNETDYDADDETDREGEE